MLLVDQLKQSPADSFEVLHEHMISTPRKYPGAVYKMGRIPTEEYKAFEDVLKEVDNNEVYAEGLLEQLLCIYIGKVPLSELVPLLQFNSQDLERRIRLSKIRAKELQDEVVQADCLGMLSELFSDNHEFAALTLIRHLILTSKRKITVTELFQRSDEQRFQSLQKHFLAELLQNAGQKQPSWKLVREARELALEEIDKDHQELRRVSLGRTPRESKEKTEQTTENTQEPTQSAIPVHQML